MSGDQGLLESDGEYQSRVAREADERTIEQSTGSPPSQGWLEDDTSYRTRIAQEANERRVESSTGTAPSRGWFEDEGHYRARVAQDASIRAVADRSGTEPSQGFFESDEHFEIRVRKEANEQIVGTATGSVPRQGWLEGDHAYRSRIAHEAREVLARSSPEISQENARTSDQSGESLPDDASEPGRPPSTSSCTQVQRGRPAGRRRPQGMRRLFALALALAGGWGLWSLLGGGKAARARRPSAPSLAEAVQSTTAVPVCADARDVELSLVGEIETVVGMQENCWSGWVRFPNGQRYWHVDGRGWRELEYPNGQVVKVAAGSPDFVAPDTDALRLRGAGEAVVTFWPAQVGELRKKLPTMATTEPPIQPGEWHTNYDCGFMGEKRGLMTIRIARLKSGLLSGTIRMAEDSGSGPCGRLFEISRDEGSVLFQNTTTSCGHYCVRATAVADGTLALRWMAGANTEDREGVWDWKTVAAIVRPEPVGDRQTSPATVEGGERLQ